MGYASRRAERSGRTAPSPRSFIVFPEQKGLFIERFVIDDSWNAQSLTLTLSRREMVRVDLIH